MKDRMKRIGLSPFHGHGDVIHILAGDKITRDTLIRSAVGLFRFERLERLRIAKNNDVRPRLVIGTELRKKLGKYIAELLEPFRHDPKLSLGRLPGQIEVF